MKSVALLTVVLLASCADGSRTRSGPAPAPPVAAEVAARPAESAGATPAPEAPEVPAKRPTGPGGGSSPGPSLADKIGGGVDASVPRVQHGTLVRDRRPAVPASPGEVALSAAGCVNAGSEDDGAKFAPRAPTRSAAPEVTVTPMRGGASVRHDVTHACCLKASATGRVDGRLAVVTEKLTGVPCRCVCGSTLTSSIALAPGEWKVAVDLDTNGSVRRVGTFEVAVK